MTTMKFAGLKVHAVGGTSVARPDALVILLHGFGAPGDDLVSLSGAITAPAGTLFLFPEAPVDLAASHSEAGDARAWWPIDVMRVQIAMMAGTIDDLAEYLRPGMAPAVAQVTQLVLEASQYYGVGLGRIVFGGFSQGAILSLEVTLESQWRLGGLVLFSGSCLDGATLVQRALPLAPTPLVVSHGRADPILPFTLAERLRLELARAGWNVDWVPFLGGHQIPPQAILAASRLVASQLS